MRLNNVPGVILALLLCFSPAAAFADLTDGVVQRLRAEGYDRIQITRTFLGRTRILAIRQDGVREIVLNPRSGEILRDWADDDDDDRDDPNDDDDRDDDDRDDDRDDDDNSGSGSENSGSGGGSDDDDDDDDDD